MFFRAHSRRFGYWIIGSTALLLSVLGSTPARAQVVGGTLSGTITDPSAAVIPQAQVAIKNVATGVTRTAITNAEGFYTATNLLPGNYEVTVSAAGFNTEVRTGITLTVGAEQILNLTMQVGKVIRKIEVTTEAPRVQLASSEISAVVNATTVRELPLNGRSWTDLATLQPGVNAIQAQPTFAVGPDRGNRGFGAQVSIDGGRPQQKNYRLDGVSINDYANGAPGSVLGGNLGVDAIQEFSVLTNNYSAEYGKTSGGVVNAISRSGANQLHGSAYEFLRNSALDARNFFDLGSIPPFKRNQFGGALGGPIRKDRTFFFADYEAIRLSKGITDTSTVPSAAARAGNLCSNLTPPIGMPGDCTANTVMVDPSVQQYLPFYPLPNAGLTSGSDGDTGTFAFPAQQVIRENFFTARVDHRFSEKDSLYGTYMYDDTPYHSPDPFNVVLLGSETLRQIFALEETHIFSPTLVNSFRAGYNRDGVANDVTLKAINPLAADHSFAADPGRFATQVLVGGLSPFNGGVGSNPTYYYFWNSWQAYDDALLTRGTHSVKFGFALERMQLNELVLRDPGGIFSFGTLSDFLVNNPSRFVTGIASTLTPRGLRQTVFGLYVQDDWRARPHLTLNLGLRWEMATVPTEVQGKLSVLRSPTDAQPHLGSPYFHNPTLRNFDPRVGFAWDPFGRGKTAIRGGAGLFDVLPLPYQFTLYASQAAPFFEFGSLTTSSTPPITPGTFFAGAFPLLTPSSLQGTYIEQNPHRSYVAQWNLNVQHSITPSLTAMVGYVGSRGIHLPWVADDMDIVLPTKSPAGYLWPVPIPSGITLNPNYGDVRGLMYKGNSFYHGLEIGIQRRLSRGLQAQVSYTWGKSIDTGSAALAGDTFGNSISSLPWYDLKVPRALSDFNIGRTLVINTTWQVPSPKSLTGAAGWITSGWELGGIYKASDGIPFSPTFGTDGDPVGLNSADPWDFASRLTGPGCKSLVNPGHPDHYTKTECFTIPSAPSMAYWTASCDTTSPIYFDPTLHTPVPAPYPYCFNLQGNAGRNILIGPGTSNLDFSVFKNHYIRRIGENFNIQFRAEVFNILNRANFAVPVAPDSTDIFNSAGAPNTIAGKLTSTTTTAREIQFAIKLMW
jgi:hypothetical protein